MQNYYIKLQKAKYNNITVIPLINIFKDNTLRLSLLLVSL